MSEVPTIVGVRYLTNYKLVLEFQNGEIHFHYLKLLTFVKEYSLILEDVKKLFNPKNHWTLIIDRRKMTKWLKRKEPAFVVRLLILSQITPGWAILFLIILTHFLPWFALYIPDFEFTSSGDSSIGNILRAICYNAIAHHFFLLKFQIETPSTFFLSGAIPNCWASVGAIPTVLGRSNVVRHGPQKMIGNAPIVIMWYSVKNSHLKPSSSYWVGWKANKISPGRTHRVRAGISQAI